MGKKQLTEPTPGARVLLECLYNEGVEYLFGYPGGANIPIYDALYSFPAIKHILVRHEQGAAHAADGYSRATGKVGTCMATSGPGATNLVTGLATAFADSIPVVAITGQVRRNLIGSDAFQEADITGIARPITKQAYLIKDIRDTTPRGASRTRGENAVVQSQVGQCEARLRSARSFLLTSVSEIWESAQTSDELTLDQLVTIRMASTWAIQSAREVVAALYTAAGALAIFDSQPFGRFYTDILAMGNHVANHFQGAGRNWGAVMMGIESQDTLL